MKKILIATTALVATAGIAAADIAITGSAEVGIFGGSSDIAGLDFDTQFHTDIDITFSMTGEADNGLTFGAKVDLDENGAFNEASQGGETYFLAFGNARLDAGDTDGAFDAALSEVNLAGGSIRDDETEHQGFNGNSGLDGSGDGQIMRFSYTFNSFTGHVSVEQGDTFPSNTRPKNLVSNIVEVDENIYGIGVAFSQDLGSLSLDVGLGYQTQADAADIWGLSVKTAFTNGITAALNYSELDRDGNDNDRTHWGIGFGYEMNQIAVGVNYGVYDDDIAGLDSDGFGIAAAYDLGGGLVAQFGYGSSNPEGDDNSNNTYSLGLAMSF